MLYSRRKSQQEKTKKQKKTEGIARLTAKPSLPPISAKQASNFVAHSASFSFRNVALAAANSSPDLPARASL
jgi:hypothetical protein